MRSGDELALVDTNVLVYAHLDDAEFHDPSLALLQSAHQGQLKLALTPQVLIEFYSVLTSPHRVSTAYQPSEALVAIDRLLAIPSLTLLPIPVDIVERWTRLTHRHPVSGPAIFDLQIVATMLANRVLTIYTYNRSDFERFAELTVVAPG